MRVYLYYLSILSYMLLFQTAKFSITLPVQRRFTYVIPFPLIILKCILYQRPYKNLDLLKSLTGVLTPLLQFVVHNDYVNSMSILFIVWVSGDLHITCTVHDED